MTRSAPFRAACAAAVAAGIAAGVAFGGRPRLAVVIWTIAIAIAATALVWARRENRR